MGFLAGFRECSNPHEVTSFLPVRSCLSGTPGYRWDTNESLLKSPGLCGRAARMNTRFQGREGPRESVGGQPKASESIDVVPRWSPRYPWPDILLIGMTLRSGPVRLLLTILVVATVPFCCCSFHAWLSVCETCPTVSAGGVEEHFAAIHGVGAAHHHDSDHHADDGSPCSGHDGEAPAPCCPDDSGDHGCKCGKHDLKMVSVEKPTVEFSAPVLIAILPWVAVTNIEPPAMCCTFRRFAWAEARPPTSLLRLHCALTI